MKEAIVRAGPKVDIVDSPIPKAAKNQIITKVIFSGSNPKDWKRPEWRGKAGEMNQGDDISGIVHEVGENVIEVKKGDRVAAFHEMQAPGGSYAEYAVSWKHTTFHLPDHTSFEEGAAIPLAALTAALGLYDRLRLAQPWTPYPEGTHTPLVVYGGSSAVGSYVLQFASRSNIHPLIVVAGKGAEHVEQFLDRSKGDTIVDYRKGNEAVVQGIKDALKGDKLLHAYDMTSGHGSFGNVANVIDPEGAVATVLPEDGAGGFAKTVRVMLTTVGDVHGDRKDFGLVFSQYISRGLDEGFFKPQPQQIIPGGLAGVEEGLTLLKNGKASAVKYIFKIEDTPGAGSGQ